MRTVLDEASVLGLVSDLISNVDADKVPFAKDIKNLANKKKIGSNNNYLGGSISRYSKDLIMTFPTLIDNSLSAETASMISKANERNIVSMLQVLFASMQLTGTNGKDIIDQIYGPARLGKRTYDDYVDSLTNVYNNLGATESAQLEDAMRDAARKMEAELKKPHKDFPTDSFSNQTLNDYQVISINGTEKITFAPVKEDNSNDMMDDPGYLKWLSDYGYAPDRDNGFFRQDPRVLRSKGAEYVKNYNTALNYSYNRQNQLAQQDIANKKWTQQQKMDRQNLYKMSADYRNSNIDAISKQLMDSDVKKANEMQPTMLIINFSEIDTNKSSEIIDQRSFIAGVKSRLISVNSSDIVERIVAKNKTRVTFLNFIRATTGEINFMKDFILCLNQAKIDAKNSLKRGEAAEMWKTLETLSVKNKRNKLRKSGNDASAITTLVINQETVNLIKKENDIDLESAPTARQLMADYNLLGIIIADESLEAVKFIYDGQDIFETQAYSFLEKENSDKSYKKIINLLGQNRRF